VIEALWPQVLEIWIGPEYLGGLRECKRIDRVTGQERWFLAAEPAVREAAAQESIPVYRTVTYGEDR
jgi:hypothetical protein